MSLEGLDFILGKKEVIPTVSAKDLIERPQYVDDDYRRHVRTYVPISRAAEGQEGQLSVEDFERKVIKQVKDARAPRGYLTAEYGYGKTSTALYLWQKAESANIITIPPFQMLELQDLIEATYGWVKYRLTVHSPHLVLELDRIYDDITSFSIENEAKHKGVSRAVIEDWVNQGRLKLDLQPTDYVKFFEQVTAIVLQAGFDGLLILPDEIQQYIEPKIKSNISDPIAPFFNLVQGLATRAGYLNFGFIMIIPLKEIGVIREARGRDDLLHRMRELSLDLSTVYDQDFAIRLWKRLTREFEFEDVATNIVTPEALTALGEIASREDLSNGPRTVINTFRRMVERYKINGHANSQPYTPIDLVEDFMNSAIQFSGNSQIQNITRRALQNTIVSRNGVNYELAVKLAAAFPTAGVPKSTQKRYGVDTALDDLMQQALGELVIAVGPIDDGGVTLFGLQRGVQQQSWLPQTIRDFRRAYNPASDQTKNRAIEVFVKLLKEQIFKGWKVAEERPANFTSNRTIVFDGDFQSFANRFPKRRIQIRILWENEATKDNTMLGDVTLNVYLSTHHHEENRRQIAIPLELDFNQNCAHIYLNLMYVRPEGVPLQILQPLEGVWSPYDLSPLILMNIYQMLEEKRADNLIPRSDDQLIKAGFQPELLDNIIRDIFNAEISGVLGGVSENRIFANAIQRLLEERYPTYQTLMSINSWRDSLRKYMGAIDRLGNYHQQRGDIEVEGTKQEIATLMVLTATGLDSFRNNYPELLKVTQDWQGRDGIGAVKFALHPLEQKILAWLQQQGTSENVTVSGKITTIHSLYVSDVFQEARTLGYQQDEIEEILNLMALRGLTEIYQKHILREVPSQSPDIEGLQSHFRILQEDVELLLKGFPKAGILLTIQTDAHKWSSVIQEQLQSRSPDPDQTYRLGRTIQKRQADLHDFARDRKLEMTKRLAIIRQGIRPLKPHEIEQLSQPINGSVQYVDQVNVLRSELRKLAITTKSNIEQFVSQLEQFEHHLRQDDSSYEILVQCAVEIEGYNSKLEEINTEYSLFETYYHQMSQWNRLVSEGSKLLQELQQMEQATSHQLEGFERLSRDIRAHISSQSKKLEALSDYAIYEKQLADISQSVWKIRESLETQFNSLQNRYRLALTQNRLFRNEQLDRSLTFNLSNPDESYRLLYESTQRRLIELSNKMGEKAKSHQSGISNIVNTPLISSLALLDQQNIQETGENLLREMEQLQDDLNQVMTAIHDVSIIRDFPNETSGKFYQLIQALVQIVNDLSRIDTSQRELANWLTKFELTPEEEHALDQLNQHNIEGMGDLIEWRNRTQMNHDEFWRAVRSLYEKQYIRLSVGYVRR